MNETFGPRKSCRKAQQSSEMPFIAATNDKRTDAATRKLIRSHVMKGRKQINNAKRSIEKKTTAALASTPVSDAHHASARYPVVIPGRLGGDLSFLPLVNSAEMSAVRLILKIPAIAAKIIAPLVSIIGFNEYSSDWLKLLCIDSAFLHISAFAIQGFLETVLLRRQEGISSSSRQHFHVGTQLLRERLAASNEEAKISDATCGTVVKLAQAAHYTGETLAAQQHIQGLRRIVDLRGGFGDFNHPSLRTEIVKCDLSIAVLNSSSPVFFRQPGEAFVPYPSQLLPTIEEKKAFRSRDSNHWMDLFDSKLIELWHVMRKFCLLVDVAAQKHRRLSADFISDTMMAVLYRVLHWKFQESSLAETFRLGMVAYSHHAFVQWQDLKLPYFPFPIAYQQHILSIKDDGKIPSAMMIWLIMVGSISLFEVADNESLTLRLRGYMNTSKIKTWGQMRNVLSSCMFIPLLDEQIGKSIYDEVRLKTGKK